ncbi:MAG TPA: erythromycin esterase family protein [Longimicrobium sp.]|jgi:erythromycin esterase-like protein
MITAKLRVYLLAACAALAACDDPAGGGGGGTTGDPVEIVRNAAHPLTGAAADYDPLMSAIGESRFVLLGEATHGTHEFYTQRARISRRLIEERGFAAIVVEAEYPAARRVHAYLQGRGDPSPEAALAGFTEFPLWMWRNAEVRDFLRDLRALNAASPGRVTFVGMDVYSLYASQDDVIAYLSRVDPAAAARARTRYACFAPYGRDPQEYGSEAAGTPAASCATQAAEQLAEMQQRAASAPADPELFDAVQSARVVRGAEEFYRRNFQPGEGAWNARDRHMAETLTALAAHLEARGQRGRIAVWAHNSHVGDARATEMGARGQLTVGQLMRQRNPNETFLLGFTTFEGEVVAATSWGAPGRSTALRQALPESYAALFHQTGVPSFLLVLRGSPAAPALSDSRLERAVGVVYAPQTERQSHYFQARLAEQFDAVIHIDRTTAVSPLP